MKVEFTQTNLSYAGSELRSALAVAMRGVMRVAMEFSTRNDNRTLVIVRTCPCCQGDPLLGTKDAVFVSPLKGISCAKGIHVMSKYPPIHDPAEDDEAKDFDEYLNAFRATIEEALAAAPVS